MSAVPARDLRNDTAGVLRRVESGEDVTITVRGRVVARLVPVREERRQWVTRAELARRLRTAQADAGLRADLARAGRRHDRRPGAAPVTAPPRGLLDTTVFIARESGRPLDVDRLPAESAVSVVTVGELHAGVLAAADTDTRAARLATLDAVADITLLPVDDAVAIAWARLRVRLVEVGRRANANDLWIAATAVAYGLPVVTQDGDFDVLEGLATLEVVRV